MDNSWLNLVPRGVGRASFHACEVIQTRSVPVYVWNDFERMPYRNAPRATYFSVNHSGFQTIFTLKRLPRCSSSLITI